MTELEVPDEAVEEIRSCLLGHESHDDAPDADCVRAIATPVVVAAVRRLACDPRLDGSAFRVLTDYARALEMQLGVETGGAS